MTQFQSLTRNSDGRATANQATSNMSLGDAKCKLPSKATWPYLKKFSNAFIL